MRFMLFDLLQEQLILQKMATKAIAKQQARFAQIRNEHVKAAVNALSQPNNFLRWFWTNPSMMLGTQFAAFNSRARSPHWPLVMRSQRGFSTMPLRQLETRASLDSPFSVFGDSSTPSISSKKAAKPQDKIDEKVQLTCAPRRAIHRSLSLNRPLQHKNRSIIIRQ